MYNELLDENQKKKDLNEKYEQACEKLEIQREQLKKRQNEVFTIKKKIENIHYDLGNLVRNEPL